MASDILAACGELPMTCYSWPLPDEVFTDPEVPSPTLLNWARVTHSISLDGEDCDEGIVRIAAEACRQVNRFSPGIPATIAVNWSPYTGAPYEPTFTGWDYTTDIMEFFFKLQDIRTWARNVEVSAVLLDHEKWKVKKEPTWELMLNEKYDTFYRIAKYVMREAAVYLYGRGESGQHLTGNELGDGTSTRIYTPDDLQTSRDHINGHRNNQNHREKYGPLMSWWLACGWSRNAFDGNRPPSERILPVEYPTENDRQIGKVIAERADNPYPEPVILYPSPFEVVLTDPWDHFAAFAEGARS